MAVATLTPVFSSTALASVTSRLTGSVARPPRRRALLAGGLAAGVWGAAVARRVAGGSAPAAPTILLKSGWQVINIGDIAHTPGMLALLERHVPEARIILWPIALSHDVQAMLLRRFPLLEIVDPALWTHRPVPEADIAPTFARADLFLHGSGPNLMAIGQLRQWVAGTGKPFGIAGITLPGASPDTRALFDRAAFVFLRETTSLRVLREALGHGGSEMRLEKGRVGLGPDAAFACDVRDDERARAYLARAGLTPGRFACFVPRLRWTPFHKMDQWYRLSAAKIEETERVNAATGDADHAKLRAAIVAWVRRTGMPALVCPEMSYQVDIIDPLVWQPLPADVRPKVARRKTFWNADEACAVYRHARAMVSLEMHSPILALSHGVPALHVRQPEDTAKAQMWRDVGLGDWLFEIDRTRPEDIARALLRVHERHKEARRQAAAARAHAQVGHRDMMLAVRRALGLS